MFGLIRIRAALRRFARFCGKKLLKSQKIAVNDFALICSRLRFAECAGRKPSALRIPARAVDHHSIDSPFSALRRFVFTKFHAQSQNTVDDVIRSVSCRVMRIGIVRALIALATPNQAIPTPQLGLDALLLLEIVTRARNRHEIA